MAENDNPLLKALPPETDYLSYLTILEYNLTKEQLPTLHGVLQDTTLTANIGWDLVHLLLPLLPESEACLKDVASLGNPREVILKVTELLEEIAHEEREDNSPGAQEADILNEKLEEGSTHGTTAESQEPPEEQQEPLSDRPETVDRISILLSMLAILHPRIKTKYPSRFLSTSLQSILLACSSLDGYSAVIELVLSFLKQLSGTKRPALPPRKSSASLATLQAAQSHSSAPDPEANTDGIADGELEIQQRLMQSFLTFIAEVFLSSATLLEPNIGLSWAERFHEKVQPQRIVPGRETMSELYEKDEDLHQRDSIMGQLLALSRDLGLKSEDLLTTILKPPEKSQEDETESSDPPSSPSDVPLSTKGSLYLLCAMLASETLFQTKICSFAALPDYTDLLQTLLPDPSTSDLSIQPPAYLDAVLFLGFHLLHNNPSTPLPDEGSFKHALQRVSLLSVQTPNPTQRYQAQQLSSSLVHTRASDDTKLSCIKDILEHCPYDNLRASAVNWLQWEILTTNPSPAPAAPPEKPKSIFSDPAVLEELQQWLWGDDVAILGHPPLNDLSELQGKSAYCLAVLKLIQVLYSNRNVVKNLDVERFREQIKSEMLDGLDMEIDDWKHKFESGRMDEYGGPEVGEMVIQELEVLGYRVEISRRVVETFENKG
ncbi:uncharacterized protein KY384_004748 [Bacidia gigantensis]|uniref:uncharacterized protein n=1 Tax=Bacidia gigantensis TaxID=2732470 RepID=UPI001D057A20|nr:uncharacterized protein KY384_004748 [Bacidia gigantensis]KAG8530247.1 hypothetical protein KY384_004748 [Bacidia gigantensis]